MYLEKTTTKGFFRQSLVNGKECSSKFAKDEFNAANGQTNKLYEHPEKFPDNAIIIEAGAFSGLDVSVCVKNAQQRHVNLEGMQFRLYEPMQDSYNKLSKFASKFPFISTFQAGISSETKTMCMNTKDTSDGAVVFQCSKGNFKVVDIASTYAETETVFLLNINCEGCEVEILERVLELDNKPLNIEVQFHRQHVSSDKYCEIRKKMAAQGYKEVYHYNFVWDLYTLQNDKNATNEEDTKITSIT